jgi:hypothetical protein
MSYLPLKEGTEIPATRFQMGKAIVSEFLKAVGEDVSLYTVDGIVPPMAVAGRAIGSLGIGTLMPPGIVHVTQKFEFLQTVMVGAMLECHFKIERVIQRGGLTLITVDMGVFDTAGVKVLGGTVGFILPQEGKS